MKLDRSIVSIDLETTGVDPLVDRIVELGMEFLFVGKNGAEPTRRGASKRFNPGVPIHPDATAVHGITDADVASCPRFAEFAGKVEETLHGKDLVGYNLRRFDLVILDEELRRCGLKLEITPAQCIIDCFGIFQKKEPRALADAVRRYCGREHVYAHSAGADAAATLDVLIGQLEAYKDLADMDLNALAVYSRGDVEYVDLGGKFQRDADGDLVFAFGKNKGRKVRDEGGYADWMLEKGQFPGSTLEVLEAELRRLETK